MFPKIKVGRFFKIYIFTSVCVLMGCTFKYSPSGKIKLRIALTGNTFFVFLVSRTFTMRDMCPGQLRLGRRRYRGDRREMHPPFPIGGVSILGGGSRKPGTVYGRSQRLIHGPDRRLVFKKNPHPILNPFIIILFLLQISTMELRIGWGHTRPGSTWWQP